jgi:hypothetical protein
MSAAAAPATIEQRFAETQAELDATVRAAPSGPAPEPPTPPTTEEYDTMIAELIEKINELEVESAMKKLELDDHPEYRGEASLLYSQIGILEFKLTGAHKTLENTLRKRALALAKTRLTERAKRMGGSVRDYSIPDEPPKPKQYIHFMRPSA